LPKEVLERLGLTDVQNISLELDRDQRRIIIRMAEKPIAIAGVGDDFSHLVNEFIDQYRPALEELAK